MNTVKGIAFAFVVALVLAVAVQAQPVVCTQNGAVDSQPACFESSLKISGGSGPAVWVEAGVIQLNKAPDGRYNIGSTTAKHTDKTLGNVWHVNWEFHNGKLNILKPMEVTYLGQPIQLGRTAPKSEKNQHGILGEIESAFNDGCNTTTCYKNGLCASTLAYCLKAGESPMILGHGMHSMPGIRSVYATPEEIQQSGPLPETICGKVLRQPSPGVDMIQVSCPRFDGLRQIAPDIPWPENARTEILVYVSKGDCVRVELDGVAYFGDVIRNSYGQLFSMITVDGVDFKSVSAKPKGDI